MVTKKRSTRKESNELDGVLPQDLFPKGDETSDMIRQVMAKALAEGKKANKSHLAGLRAEEKARQESIERGKEKLAGKGVIVITSFGVVPVSGRGDVSAIVAQDRDHTSIF